MEDHHVNVKRSATARLEHIDAPDGEGVIRWHIINRGSEGESDTAVDDARGGGVAQPPRGKLQQVRNLCKRVLFFWH